MLTALLCGSATAAGGELQVALKEVASGFVSPTVLTTFGDGSGRLLVADQVGVIYLLGKDGSRSELIDLRPRLAKLNEGFDERGILGVALHPQFMKNRRFFVYYSAPLREGGPAGWDHTSHVAEFRATDRGVADPKSERIVMTIDQPQFNHNGGRMAFGPDGYLYIAVGDGGQANDMGVGHSPQGNGQDTTTLLGKILRIDVDRGNPYANPMDNPFVQVQGGGRPEIFAYGFRNPWGISFDRGGKQQLFSVDVGQDSFEEVNIVENGGNYGWRIREGFACFDPKNPTKAPADCPKVGADGKPLRDPILAYKNFKAFRGDPEARGISVTGGYVYRGKGVPELHGRYVFADWSRNWVFPMGVLFAASPSENADGRWKLETLSVAGKPGTVGAYVVAFGEDADGELYVLTNDSNSLRGNTGKVWKLVKP